MADAHKNFKIRRFPRAAGAWTPIVVPQGEFSRIVIENSDLSTDAVFRTDVDDGLTEKTIPMGQELDIFSKNGPFIGGETIGYFYLSTALPPVVSFVR